MFLGTVTAGDINLDASGNMDQAQPITTSGTMTVHLTGAATAHFVNAGNNVSTLVGIGGGALELDNGANSFILSGLGATQSFFGTTSGTITFSGDIATSGNIAITANGVVNAHSVTAALINVASKAGHGLSVDGGAGGSFNATGSGQSVTFTATDLDLDLFGKITFVSKADMFATVDGVQEFIVNTGANIIGQQALNVNACDVVLQGSIIGNPLNFICNEPLTIGNGAGNVVLTGNIGALSKDFAIIASGNIDLTGVTGINLFNPGGDAGSLTMLAGFNFSPALTPQFEDDTTPFTGFTPTGTGSILGAGVPINLSSGTAVGGRLIAASNGGGIALGSINTTGGTIGGGVFITADGNLTVGDITTTGGTSSGSVFLSNSKTTIQAAPTILNGTLSNGTFAAGATVNGNMTLGSINAGSADVSLTGALAAPSAINITTGTITANNLTLLGGTGFITLAHTSLNTVSITSNGDVSLNDENGALSMTLIAGANMQLYVSASGQISTPNTALFLNSLALYGGNTAGSNAIVLNGDINVTLGLTLQSYNDGNISTGGKSITATDVNLIGLGNGKVIVNSAVTGTNSVLIQAGGDLLNADVDLTNVTAPNLFLASSNGDIGDATTSTRFNTTQNDLNLTASSGSILVQSNATGIVNVKATALDDIDILSPGIPAFKKNTPPTGLILDDLLSANGDIIVSQLQGNIATTGTANIIASDGSVSISLTTTDKKQAKLSTINFAQGTDIEALNGDLTITVATTNVPVAGKTPKDQVALNPSAGGQILFGKKGITVSKTSTLNTLTAKGADLIFNSVSKKNLILNGGTFTADPPNATEPVFAALSAPVEIAHALRTSDVVQNGMILPTTSNTTPDASFNLISQATPNTASLIKSITGVDMSNSISSLAVSETNIEAGGTPALPGLRLISASSTNTGLSTQAVFNAQATQAVYNAQATQAVYNAQATQAVYNAGSAGVSPAYTQSSTLANDLLIDADVHNTGTHRFLKNENVIFTPSTDTTVETSHGTLKLNAGSIALIMESESGLAIYDLHDNGKNSVVLETATNKISLSPGRHLHVSKQQNSDFDSINTIELAQYRRLNQSKLVNGCKVYTSEFSVPSVCYAVKSLRTLMSSKHTHSKTLANRILKTTAVLMTIAPDRGDFVQYFKPRVTAMR